jgi:hypothetical protein
MDSGFPGNLSVVRRRFASSGTTPVLIEAAAVLILLLLAMVLFGSEAEIGRYREAVERIGQDTEPTVLVAEKLTAMLADMDAEIADSALGNGAGWPQYVADTNEISALLVTLSTDARYSPAETAGLIDLVARLRGYYQLVGGSSVNSPDIVGSNEQLSMTTTLWASRLIRHDLIPEAQIIKARAGADLATAYADYRKGSLRSLAIALAPLLLLLVALLSTQILLIRRTRRLINIPLAAATILLAALITWFVNTAISDRADIIAAKEKFFDDLKVVSDAKISAHLMKADESMWLFEYRRIAFEQRQLRQHYAHAFMNSAEQLLDCAATGAEPPPAAETHASVEFTAIDALSGTLARCAPLAAPGGALGLASLPANFTGPLAEELRRGRDGAGSPIAVSTEDAEARGAGSAAIAAFLAFLKIDQQIRTLMLAGQRPAAVQLSIGHDADESNGAFADLTAALDRLIALDDAGFKQRIDAAARHVAAISSWLGIALVATLLATAIGLWPRYREYR